MKESVGEIRANHEVLPEHEAKELLADYGLPVPDHAFVSDVDEVGQVSRDLDFPVVMKIVSSDIQHKSDVGGVVLDITSPADAEEAFEKLTTTVREARPNADIQGVLVEEMIDGEQEFFVGVKDDQNFELVVMAGLGGTAVELFEDVSLRLPPLDRDTCRSMLESLQSYPLLTGFRGSEPADVEALIDVLVGLAGEDGLLEDVGDEIAEMDLNPIIVRADGDGCVIADALITLDR